MFLIVLLQFVALLTQVKVLTPEVLATLFAQTLVAVNLLAHTLLLKWSLALFADFLFCDAVVMVQFEWTDGAGTRWLRFQRLNTFLCQYCPDVPIPFRWIWAQFEARLMTLNAGMLAHYVQQLTIMTQPRTRKFVLIALLKERRPVSSSDLNHLHPVLVNSTLFLHVQYKITLLTIFEVFMLQSCCFCWRRLLALLLTQVGQQFVVNLRRLSLSGRS